MSADQTPYRSEVGPLRDPATLMQPERLGALKQTRLSFARLLASKMIEENWEIELEEVDLDENGDGRAIYRIETPSKRFSFAVSSRRSSEGENTDRIIAETWDMEAFLCEGEATDELVESQFAELPDVRKGRATSDVLIWTRANRSSRFFDHIVDSLAAGHQPDIDHLATGGYLVRSSGYYGNGLNGTKVFEAMDGDHPLKRPYLAQMLAVYMLRSFGYDLAEEMAAARSADAVALDRDIKRYLGTGNSSGVGIIMNVVNHPQLVHAWIRAREVAFARVKTIDPEPADVDAFADRLDAAERWFVEDESETHEFFLTKDRIADELRRTGAKLSELHESTADVPLWGRLWEWADRNLESETQEVLHSLLLDVHPAACRGLEDSLTTSEKTDIVPEMAVSTLGSLLTSSYQWALDIDLSQPGAREHFWYRSIENEEPRMGRREGSDYLEYELPVAIASRVQDLATDLESVDGDDTVAEFLFEHPEHRDTVERVQTVHDLPYAEVRGNPLDADFVPLHYISCLKAIWGIQKAHPKSKGWVRGTFFQGAPLPVDLREGADDDWMYPPKPERAAHWRGD